MAYRMGYDYKKFRNKDHIVKIFPFSSEKKKMATVYQDDKGAIYVFVKGAPDFLTPYCTKFVNRNGHQTKMTTEYTESLQQTIVDFANESLRTLLLSYKEVSSVPEEWDDIERDLCVLGLVGIKDPLRDGIQEAVKACHEAGVRVRMVTGDNKRTAIAIAKEAGILSKDWVESEGDCSVMEGKEFREFVGGLANEGTEDETVGDIENFKVVRDQLCVLARSSPDDKYLMATGLKKLDHVVAMTGDGTNDAPALKKADIGFAMGIAGTEVAKEASGIILLDDNFSSIVTAMKWGRNIFDSIRKFLQFQLTVNFVALVMAFVGGAVLRESPLNPIQMLWVNLIMDTLASLALATEPPSDELLKRKPYSRYESLITATMWRNIISQGIWQIIILGTILFKGNFIINLRSRNLRCPIIHPRQGMER
jgi:Ca2+ transporting ATPase